MLKEDIQILKIFETKFWKYAKKRCNLFSNKKGAKLGKKVRVLAIYFLVKKGARLGNLFFNKKKCEFGQKRCDKM